jgi:molybdopterin converting factor small subunit
MKIMLSGALLRFADYSKEVEVPAASLGEGIDRLTTRYPQLKPVLLDGNGGVRETHQMFLNGEQIMRAQRTAGAPPVPVADGDTLFILTAIAGG